MKKAKREKIPGLASLEAIARSTRDDSEMLRGVVEGIPEPLRFFDLASRTLLDDVLGRKKAAKIRKALIVKKQK